MQKDPAFNPGDESRGILAAIVESSGDAILSNDLDGVVVSWNQGAERMYGYTAAEVVGQSISILAPADRREEIRCILDRIRAGEVIAPCETAQLTKDRRIVEVGLTVSPIRDTAGRVIGAATIARDITESKQVERALRTSEARWRAIIESAVDGIVVIDAHGTIEAFNAAAERLFGYHEHEVRGQNVKVLMPLPYREEHDQYLARYLETGVQKVIGIGREVTGQRKDGSTFPVRLSVGELSIEGARKFTGILHDLTDRVQMEQRLREQTALTRLGEMAAIVAHEVKNPLAGIRGAIQVIGGSLPAGSRNAAVVKEIVARIDALNDLMKDLLLFARPPQLRLGPVDIVSLMRLVAEIVRQDSTLREVRIDVSGSAPAIIADAELLKIVVHNLLLNGAHAMQGRGSIQMSVTSANGECQIAIADSGPGISPEVREKLFTPFFTTKARGTGLGLSTAKRLMEAHGGSIAIDCPSSGGTVVTLRLPVQAAEP